MKSSQPVKLGKRRFVREVLRTAMGKPPFKASEGGRIDILREWEEITQSELQQGSGAQVLLALLALKVRPEAFPDSSPMPVW